MPELSIVAQVEPITIFTEAPADVTPNVWTTLAKTIFDHYKTSSGFVVFHGPDNLLYTASAISFIFKNLTKPIIFTGGSITPQADKRLEMRANLINAIQGASYEYAEVGLMFGNRFIRANQATRSEGDTLNMFSAPQSGMLGKIDFSIRLADKIVLKNRGAIKYTKELNANIEVITLSPLVDLTGLANRLLKRDGIIINAGMYEQLPRDLQSILQKNQNIPAVVWSLKIPSASLTLKNVLLVNNMTWESAVTKFIVLRSETDSIKQIKELMARDQAGEIIH
jgi:L-asparaginase